MAAAGVRWALSCDLEPYGAPFSGTGSNIAELPHLLVTATQRQQLPDRTDTRAGGPATEELPRKSAIQTSTQAEVLPTWSRGIGANSISRRLTSSRLRVLGSLRLPQLDQAATGIAPVIETPQEANDVKNARFEPLGLHRRLLMEFITCRTARQYQWCGSWMREMVVAGQGRNAGQT